MAGNPRDVNLDIVGHDHTRAATTSAGRNLDHLKRKVNDVNDSNGGMGRSAKRAATEMAQSFVKTATVLRSAGPYVVVAALIAAIASLPAVAVIAGIGLVGALGGGIAFIGLKFAAMNKDVRKEWTKTKDHVVAKLKELSKPFVPVLIDIAQRARDTFDSFAPALGDAFKSMAPAINLFAARVLSAFEKLKPALKPLTDAFNVLLDRIGKKAPEIFKTLADAITDISNAIANNPGAIDAMIEGLLWLIRTTGKVIATLIRWFTYMQLAVASARDMAVGIKLWFAKINVYAAQLVSNVINHFASLPGPLGAPFRSMAKEAKARVATAQAALNSVKTEKSRSEIERLKAKIATLKGKKVVTTADKNEIAAARRRIYELQNTIDGLHGKTIRVGTIFYQTGKKPGTYGRGLGVLANSSGTSWEDISGRSRIGGAAQNTATAFDLTTNVTIDGSPMRAMVRTAVNERASADAWRAKTGRR